MTEIQPLAGERPRGEAGRAFELESEFSPAGDQPQAIQALIEGLRGGKDGLWVPTVKNDGTLGAERSSKPATRGTRKYL